MTNKTECTFVSPMSRDVELSHQRTRIRSAIRTFPFIECSQRVTVDFNGLGFRQSLPMLGDANQNLPNKRFYAAGQIVGHALGCATKAVEATGHLLET